MRRLCFWGSFCWHGSHAPRRSMPMSRPTNANGWPASGQFYLRTRPADYARTFQHEHPGVTVMWAGTLGLLSISRIHPAEPGYFTWGHEHFEAWLQPDPPHPLEVLAASRRWVALGSPCCSWSAFSRCPAAGPQHRHPGPAPAGTRPLRGRPLRQLHQMGSWPALSSSPSSTFSPGSMPDNNGTICCSQAFSWGWPG
jgi:hypothetical protein